MPTKVEVVVGAGAATVVGCWLAHRWWKYRVFFEPVYTAKGVLPYKQDPPENVCAGKVDGEYRGECPMDPPVILQDELYWLRDDERKDTRVISHLNRENAYFESKFRPFKALQETDEEVPYPHGKYYYYTRTVKGLPYPIHCRKKDASPGREGEEVVLDVNLVGKGKSYCDVQDVVVSPDHSLVAYTVDFTGYETYEIVVKDVASGQVLQDKVGGSAGEVVWGQDQTELFYTTMDEKHRPDKVWRHRVGEGQEADELLFTEEDELFWLDVHKTCSGRFFIVNTSSSTRTEVHILDLETRGATLQVVQPRQDDHRYQVEHWGDDLFIVTNADGCVNSKLVKTPISHPTRWNWRDVMPYEKTTKLDYLVCFKDYIVINGRSNGLKMVRVRDMRSGHVEELRFGEECYDVYSKKNKEFNSTKFRYGYSSLITPHSTFDYDMVSRTTELRKEQEVPNYDRSLYHSERTFAMAGDGTKVPICLVYRKDCNWAKHKKASPMMLYGYGSYGICVDPSFDSKCISYLDRGMIFAIANIRGGGEMGRQWYEEEGKYLKKMNTFQDFCDCAKHLISQGYTTSDQLAISGRSAGGLLMGAVLNLRPDLFKVAVAGVPFVDVLTTMCDPTIPLTVGEWEEWGNPNEEQYFQYIRSYSPVDNVRQQAYPHVLVTAGLNDPRVPYWEPAKWVIKLREKKTDNNMVLLKTDMSSGHFAASDRYRLMEDRSIEYAFVAAMLKCPKLLPVP